MSVKKSKQRRRPDDVWLGAQREKDIAWLQTEMSHPIGGKEKTRLARQARALRHGSDILGGAQRRFFSLSLRELNIPRIGVF